jgi:drug/metabolite transporter (DMT)-like permease
MSAVGWGASDFVGGLSSRRAGAFQSVLFVQLIGMFFLPILAFGLKEPIISWQEWLWCAGAGGFGVLALALLFQAFEEGKMSLAAPVSAVTSAALPILVGFFTQGFQGFAKISGFTLALVAVWLISWADTGKEKIILRMEELRLPLLAGIGFSLYYVLIYEGSQNAIIWPMIASRSTGMVVLVATMIFQHKKLIPGRNAWPLLMLNFFLDLGANVMYILAGQSGRMDIAAVLTSLYPGITILLAWLILKERIQRLQTVGILLALGAILLIAR